MTEHERVACGLALKPTLFLDRDGTINRHIGYLDRPEQIELLPGVGAAICRLNRAGVLAVVVTNQAVIARGQCSESDLDKIHVRLKEELGQHGAYLDAIYYCPHHPDRGQPGEVTELKIVCRGRKPQPGMIEEALRELPIDPNQCAVVGDTERDVGLARNCRLPCYWITSTEQLIPAHVTRVELVGRAGCSVGGFPRGIGSGGVGRVRGPCSRLGHVPGGFGGSGGGSVVGLSCGCDGFPCCHRSRHVGFIGRPCGRLRGGPCGQGGTRRCFIRRPRG